jgi:hypothetical protein
LCGQLLARSLEIADPAYVPDDGAIIYSGTAAELASDEERVRSMAGASQGMERWPAQASCVAGELEAVGRRPCAASLLSLGSSWQRRARAIERLYLPRPPHQDRLEQHCGRHRTQQREGHQLAHA